MTAKRNIAVWEFDSGTERDNTGSNKGLISGDLGYVRNDAVYLAATVGATTSTWIGVGVLTTSVLDFKGSARVRTTANVDLAAGGLAAGTTHDGVLLAEGERVLVMGQTATEENGLYDVPAAGAASRSGDANTSDKVTAGLFVHVSEGTLYSDTWWYLSTNDPIVLGTTGLTFENMSMAIDHGAMLGLGDDDHTQYLLVSGARAMAGDLDMGTNAVQNSGGMEFAHLAANPGGTPTDTLYVDDGTSFEDGTLWWGNKLVVEGEVSVGSPGGEQGAFTVSGASFDSILKVHDFGGTRSAMATYHRHSTTDSANLMLTRSNSDTSAHGDVTGGQVLATVYGAGWNTGSFYLATAIDFAVDGTPGVGDMPGRIVFRTTPDGSSVPVERMRIDNAGRVLIAGAASSNGPAGADELVIGDGTAANFGLTIFTGNANIGNINFTDTTGTFVGRVTYNHSGDVMSLYTATSERVRASTNAWSPGTAVTGLVDLGISATNRWRDLFMTGAAYLAGAVAADAVTDSANLVIGNGTANVGITMFPGNTRIGSWTVSEVSGAMRGRIRYSGNSEVWLMAVSGVDRYGWNATEFYSAAAYNLGSSTSPWGTAYLGASGGASAHEVYGSSMTFANVSTDATNKSFAWLGRPYTNADGSVYLASYSNTAAGNLLLFGDSVGDSPTEIRFHTATAVNTAGTLNGYVSSTGNWTLGRSAGSNTHLVYGSIWGKNVDTDATAKTFLLYGGPYTNADGAYTAIRFDADASNNTVQLGSTSTDSVTRIQFCTATALNTAGTLRGWIDSAGALNWTGQVLLAGAVAANGPAGADELVIGDGALGNAFGITIFTGTNAAGTINMTDVSGAVRGSWAYDHAATAHIWGTEGASALVLDASYLRPYNNGGLGLGSTTANAWSSLALAERADHVGTPTPGRGEVWLQNTASPANALMFTDDDGVDHVVSGQWRLSVPGSGGTTTITVDDYHVHIDNSTVSGGGYTISLPAVSSFGAGKRVLISVKGDDDEAQDWAIDAADTLNGGGTGITRNHQNEGLYIAQTNANGWQVWGPIPEITPVPA